MIFECLKTYLIKMCILFLLFEMLTLFEVNSFKFFVFIIGLLKIFNQLIESWGKVSISEGPLVFLHFVTGTVKLLRHINVGSLKDGTCNFKLC